MEHLLQVLHSVDAPGPRHERHGKSVNIGKSVNGTTCHLTIMYYFKSYSGLLQSSELWIKVPIRVLQCSGGNHGCKSLHLFSNRFSALKLSERSLARTTGAVVKLGRDRDLKLVPLVTHKCLPVVHIILSAEKSCK
jgi:hypothetical protein